MRITGGRIGGQVIKVPRGSHVRPTQERVREALFSSLGEGMVGSAVLDCYAGSGALGIEAWSRGAASVEWVEQDGRVFKWLKENVTRLCGAGPAATCHKSDVAVFLTRSPKECYDFILADPPYERHSVPFDSAAFLARVCASRCLRSGGVLVLEQRASQEAAQHQEWRLLRDKVYGETRLVFYTQKSNDVP